MFIRRLIFIILAAIFCANLAFADINQELSDMFDRWGFEATATGGGAYEGQTRGYWVGGSLNARAKRKPIDLLSINPPSLKAGCGGIDYFTGAFSFLNAEQLVNALKAIGQNAIGYAFQLALEVLCPKCHNIITKLQHWANQVNHMNRDSCWAAKLAVNSLYGAITGQVFEQCKSAQAEHGGAVDRVMARLDCIANFKVGENSVPADKKEQERYTGNVIWQALKKKLAGVDDSYRELAMNIVGTIIIRGEGDKPEIRKLPPVLNVRQLWACEGGEKIENGKKCKIKLYKCDEYDNCMNPTQEEVTFEMFQTKTKRLLDDIADKIAARESLTDDEKSFINIVPVPVYRMLKVAVTYPGLPQMIIDQSSDFIAMLIAQNFIYEAVHAAATAYGHLSTKLTAGIPERAITQNLRDARDLAREETIHSMEQLRAINELINTVMLYERWLNDRIPESLRNNLHFAQQ